MGVAVRDFCFSRGAPKGKNQGAVWDQQRHCSPQAGGRGSPLSPPPQGSATRAQDIYTPRDPLRLPVVAPALAIKPPAGPLSPGQAPPLPPTPGIPAWVYKPTVYAQPVLRPAARVLGARSCHPALTQTRHSPHRSSPSALSPQVSLALWLGIEGKEATAQRPADSAHGGLHPPVHAHEGHPESRVRWPRGPSTFVR